MNYQTLASKGRYGDNTMVHMNPQEVAGLNALGAAYGRPMTINPQTGYPEAFNLSNLLPMLIGTGLNIASGGALTPLQVGMATGAGYTLATGDPRKGLAAGFGAAGGAGIGKGLTAAGSTTMPIQGASTLGENFARAGQGIKALGSTGGMDAFIGQAGTAATPATGIGGIGGLAKSTAMSMAPGISDSMKRPSVPKQPAYIRPYSLDIQNLSGDSYTSSAERPQLTYKFQAETPYRVAQGGPIRYQEGGVQVIDVEGMGPKTNDGRFLRGDGDGMSDEISASIEGEVDALLSDGEFVIPADVVSHLGNGSSEAGAKVLYEMMDRIRKERTGTEEQAKEVEVERILPA